MTSLLQILWALSASCEIKDRYLRTKILTRNMFFLKLDISMKIQHMKFRKYWIRCILPLPWQRWPKLKCTVEMWGNCARHKHVMWLPISASTVRLRSSEKPYSSTTGISNLILFSLLKIVVKNQVIFIYWQRQWTWI